MMFLIWFFTIICLNIPLNTVWASGEKDIESSVEEQRMNNSENTRNLLMEQCGENLTWRLEDGVLIVSGTGDMFDYNYGGNNVWYAPLQLCYGSIKKIVIENGVTSIGKEAFYGCENATEIVIPSSVTKIGESAFYSLGIESVILPENLSEIERGTFQGCQNLKEISIPENVTRIGVFAFEGCENLKEIDILGEMNRIEAYAFSGCPIESFRWMENLNEIPAHVFDGCEQLKEFEMSDNVRTIGEYAFANCNQLKEIKLSDNVTMIDKGVFYCAGIVNIKIPKYVEMIGESAFYGCTELEKIEFESTNLRKLEEETFGWCRKLKNINIPDSIKEIGWRCFSEFLETIYFKGEAVDFNEEAFADVEATAYYPKNDSTWTEEVKQDYGGKITWVEWDAPTKIIEEIQTEKTIKRNGPGYVQAKFYLCDVNKKPLKNTMFNYYYEKDGQAYVFYDKQTDENGAFTFPTHYLNEGEACDVVFRVDLKNSKLQPYTDTYTIHASATYLSYTEEWDLSFGGGLEYGETLKGGKSKTFDRTITLKHREDGRKDLEVSLKATTENAAKLAGSLLKLKAQSENIGTSLKIVDASVSQKAKNYTMWTLAIENYDENKQEHQKMVGNFLMILIALENSNNTMLNKALSNYDLELGSVLKSISEGCCVELGEGSSLAILDLGIGDISKVTSKLTPVDNKTVYQCSSRKDFKKNMQEHEMGISAESSLNLFSYSLLDAFGYSGFNDYGFEGFYKLDKSSFVVSQNEIKLKSEHSDEKYSGLAGDKVSRSFTFTVKDGEAAKLKEKNSKFKEIETGKGGLLNKVHMQNMADDILHCNEIQYTETDKTKIKLSGKFSSKIENLLSLDLSYSATRTTLLDVAGGEKDNGGLYCTWKSANDISGISGSYAATDLGAIVDPANRELFAELCKYVVSEIGNPVKGMVQNLGAKILQTNMSCMVTLAMIDEKTAGLFYSRNTEHTEVDSRKEVALVGNAYSVYVTDEEENGINDFAEEPLILELSYNEEELVNAGLDLKDVESLHIGRYDTGSGSYENVGGELDAENQLLRVSIDKPGQYVLMSDKNAPVISNITVSDATPKPTIGMEIVDLGKISAVEMSIDDFILIDKENYMDYYNPLSNVLVYKMENELAVGMHEIQIKATDSSGNISEYTKKTFAVAGMPQISGVAVPEQYQDGVDIIVIVDGYAIHCVEANVTAVKTDKTEVSEMYAMNRTSGKNEWKLHIGDKDTEKYEINFTVYDDAGHEVKSQQYLTVHKTDIPNKPNMDITVKKKPHQLTITSALKKTLGDKPFRLNAYSPTGGKLNYVSSNPKAAKVDDKGKVTITGVGKTVITITAKPDENYAVASAKTTITVIPKNISGLKVKAQSGGKCKVSWKKATKVSGYQVRYSVKSSMKSSRKVKAAGARKSSVILKKLKKGKKYYVQARAYQKVNETVYYSNWSKKKKIKIR